ncbi:MAG TPA: hypothetical protein VJT84_01000 [Gaiellaceae bacterium]|nr:hypothetical protein [Gaiellaceae bacterium]
MKVWLSADTLGYTEGGGHFWAYLNWALGLRALGCDVVWLEGIGQRPVDASVSWLRSALERYGLGDAIALWSWNGTGRVERPELVDLDEAPEADLLLNLRYDTRAEVVARFRRSALVDIDPGLLQTWLRLGQMAVPEHDVYFSTGENVSALDADREWLRTRPCVALDRWLPASADEGAAFTTVSHWYDADEWFDNGNGAVFGNDKRAGFLPFLDLPRRAQQRLELAILLADDDEQEQAMLTSRGWRVRSAHEVASTPDRYQDYIRASRGEFSCAKPSAVYLRNAWVSDRTVCYLASAKPAVVQYTGPSDYLPADEGLWRFRTIDDAALALDRVAAGYERQCRLAREVAEQHFDAREVVGGVLERAVP